MTIDGMWSHRSGLGYTNSFQRGLAAALLRPPTTRFVYFSFHYNSDIMRVQQIKNHWVAKGSYTAAGYFDGSLEEKAKKESEATVKNAIDNGMVGSSVTCVLIGALTCTRRWVAYEICRSIERGMGIFGIRIHAVPDPRLGTCLPGPSPFDYIFYQPTNTLLHGGKSLRPMWYSCNAWSEFALAARIEHSASPYLVDGQVNWLKDRFRIYDWVAGDGYNNFPAWADAAANEVGK